MISAPAFSESSDGLGKPKRTSGETGGRGETCASTQARARGGVASDPSRMSSTERTRRTGGGVCSGIGGTTGGAGAELGNAVDEPDGNGKVIGIVGIVTAAGAVITPWSGTIRLRTAVDLKQTAKRTTRG